MYRKYNAELKSCNIENLSLFTVVFDVAIVVNVYWEWVGRIK